jgi:tRNA threonylcarbamoyladenosine biosynthesis protein TsaE
LGVEEFFESSGVTFIEWADRVARCLPAARVEIACEAVGESARRFTLSATTPQLEACLDRVQTALTG